MRRFFVVLSLFFFVACSKDQPAPVAPAGKAADDDFGVLLDLMSILPDSIDTSKIAQPDSVEAVEDSIAALPDSLRFNIELRFHDSVPASHRHFFRQGADRWEEVVVGDLPAAVIPSEATNSNRYQTPYSPELIAAGTLVDDIIITVTYDEAIRGTAVGGSTWLREETRLPMAGFVVVDGEYMVDWFHEVGEKHAYWEETINASTWAEAHFNLWLYEAAVHEIGHALGIGTIWWLDDRFHYDEDPMKSYFAGEHAIAAFQVLPGASYKGEAVPVYGSGHWNGRMLGEATMDNHGVDMERISTITVGALADLGYEVDFSQGHVCTVFDPETHPFSPDRQVVFDMVKSAMYERYPDIRRADGVHYTNFIRWMIQEGHVEDGYDGIFSGAGKAVARSGASTAPFPFLCGVK